MVDTDRRVSGRIEWVLRRRDGTVLGGIDQLVHNRARRIPLVLRAGTYPRPERAHEGVSPSERQRPY
jgi:hypothetical protein